MMMNSCDFLFLNATTIDTKGMPLEDQAIVVNEGQISWCGATKELPQALHLQAKNIELCNGRLITPGLIDCHTHLVYAGNRAAEFQLKLQGISYADIAAQGGGILSTVQQTRLASEARLLEESLPRILDLKRQGVTTVEIKSGYGLDFSNEVKMLRVGRQLGELSGMRVRTTFLGAHTVPPEYQGASQKYVDVLCHEMMPALVEENLVDAVDVFCEGIAFSLEQTEQLFIKAKELNLPVKCHAEQLSNLGASVLAAKFNALSCDHLEWADEASVAAMARAKTVAVLLPGAHYFLKEKKMPPVALLRAAGVGMAIATDCNPGSSPTTSLQLMMNMACRRFSMTVPEVLAGVTFQAAKALGLEKETGAIQKGLQADLILWSTTEVAALCYYFAYPLEHQTMIAGQWVN